MNSVYMGGKGGILMKDMDLTFADRKTLEDRVRELERAVRSFEPIMKKVESLDSYISGIIEMRKSHEH